MLIPESWLPAFTILHVAISLAAIASSFVVMIGMTRNQRLEKWSAFCLTATALTSLTGFGFPIKGWTPGLAFGVITLFLLAAVYYARYRWWLIGPAREVYIVGCMISFYLNFVVLIVQSFQKIGFLHALAPTQSEPPFLIAQLVSLAAFLVLGVLSFRKFRPSII